ncbi:hypothetical protein BD410DRAFT_805578 [Rickenella mellea]|uniref:Uncharacterized protein n=1 Tax=Rickenella mellea TaxID=50990 RepID=A0A4Y7PXG6_9AGAM|nr:hypothetical protein BD410DRAFT_805578 [Rickenella mellea]
MAIGEDTSDVPEGHSSNQDARNAIEQHIIEPLPLRRLQALRGDPIDDVSRVSTGFRPVSPRLVGADVSSSPISPLQLPSAKPVRPISALQISTGEYSMANTSFQSVESHSVSILELNTGGAETIDSNEAETKEVHLNTHALPVEQLDFALSQANLRLSDVRSKLDELVPLVKESVPQEFHGPLSSLRGNADIVSNVPPSHSANAPSTMSHSYNAAFHSLSDMSKEQLQKFLAALLSSLSLPVTALDELDQRNSSRPAACPSTLRSVSDIHRAVSFVSTVDELVWRRSLHTPPHEDPFGEENVHALIERVELWEKAVRIRR